MATVALLCVFLASTLVLTAGGRHGCGQGYVRGAVNDGG